MPINIVCNFNAACPAAEQAAINRAAATWNAIAGLNSPVPISVRVAWGVNLNPGANAMNPAHLTAITIPGGQHDQPMFPLPNTWYLRALADKIAGADLDPGQPDLLIAFDSINFLWYTGPGLPVPAGSLDLQSVALHEMGHGLGFVSLSWIDAANNGSFGNNAVLAAVNAVLPPGIGHPAPPDLLDLPTVFDHSLEDQHGTSLTDPIAYPNPGPALGAVFISNQVFFNPNAGPPIPIQIHAPAAFQPFTSIDHLDNPAALMRPGVNPGVAVRAVDADTIAVLNTLGW